MDVRIIPSFGPGSSKRLKSKKIYKAYVPGGSSGRGKGEGIAVVLGYMLPSVVAYKILLFWLLTVYKRAFLQQLSVIEELWGVVFFLFLCSDVDFVVQEAIFAVVVSYLRSIIVDKQLR
ncbi:hypothetical protein Tco_0195592 [Tanacetum coccineum]